MKNLFTLIIFLFLLAGSIHAQQTVLISPTGDGGFETGNTLALNHSCRDKIDEIWRERKAKAHPEKIHKPSSSSLFKGIQRMVALVKSLIFSSVSGVPSQCAEINPVLFSRTSLNSSNEFTSVTCVFL